MKNLKQVRLSYKTRAIMSAFGCALMIADDFIPDNTVLTSFLAMLVAFVAMFIILVATLYKPEATDELFEHNYAKASSITLMVIYAVLLIIGIGADTIGHPRIELDHRIFTIAYGGLYSFQCILLAFFEGKGVSGDTEE